MLGLGSNMMKHPVTGKSIVRDGLVLQHNYNLSSVEPLSSGAASFDGTDDYIALGASNSLVTSTNVTLACWFQLLGDEDGYIFQNQKGIGSSNIFLRLNLEGHGFIGAGVWTGSTHSIISFDGNLDTTSSWHHVAYVTTSSAQVLYLDGVAVATSASTFANAASSDQSTLGSINGTINFFKGYMANMGVWSTALSQAQVKSIMNKNYAGLTASEKTDLVSWWNLDSVIPDTTTLVYDNHHGGEGEVLGSELLSQPVDLVTDFTAVNGGSFTDANTLVTTGGSIEGFTKTSFLTVGKSYKLIIAGTTTSSAFSFGNTTSGGNEYGTGFGTHYFTASGNTAFWFRQSTAGTTSITSFTLKLINGNTGTLS